MHRLVYVSESRLTDGGAKREIFRILVASRRNNLDLGITGGLLHTGRHFAQVLEGDAAAIRALYARLGGDSRHAALRLIAEREASRRLFNEWSMAYCGTATYVQRQVDALLMQPDASTIDQFERLMVELAAVGGIAAA